MRFTGHSINKSRRPGLKRGKFIYSKKSYSNPFFRNKRASISRSNGFISNKIKLAVFASIVAVLILVWLLFFSNLFKITKIEISGVGDNLAAEIELLAYDIAENKLVGKNNLLLYDKSELDQALNNNYYLEDLKIQKKLFHTLKISLAEKRQTAVWHEDDKYYYLDNDGLAINQIDPLNINRLNYPVIENLTGLKIKDREVNINKPTIEYILSLFNEFKDKKHGFEIEKFILDKDINTVKLAILAGPKIYFNTEASAAEQTLSLNLIIKEKLKDSFMSKEYIDLRYGENIYIK